LEKRPPRDPIILKGQGCKEGHVNEGGASQMASC